MSFLRCAEPRSVISLLWMRQKLCSWHKSQALLREARSYGYRRFQRDDRRHAFRGAKQPVRQLSNNSDRQSVDVSMCSYSSFTHSMKRVLLDWFCLLVCALINKKGHVISLCSLRVVDYLEAFTLPEGEVWGRSGLVVIQRHEGCHTSCQERKFGCYQRHTGHTGGIQLKQTIESKN